jgi:hypothetical protein
VRGATIKKIALFSYLVLAFALITPGWAARAAAQKAKAKDAIETAFPSRAGDRAKYAMTVTQRGETGMSKLCPTANPR